MQIIPRFANQDSTSLFQKKERKKKDSTSHVPRFVRSIPTNTIHKVLLFQCHVINEFVTSLKLGEDQNYL